MSTDVERQLGFDTEEEFRAYLQQYVDRMDCFLRTNEFSDAEKVLRDLIADVLNRRLGYIRHALFSAQEASQATQKLVEVLRKICVDLEVLL